MDNLNLIAEQLQVANDCSADFMVIKILSLWVHDHEGTLD